MKLELRHLSAYLPYGLRIDYGRSNPKNNTRYNFKLNGTNASKVLNFEEFKPILHPISDLKKNIEIMKNRSLYNDCKNTIYSDYELDLYELENNTGSVSGYHRWKEDGKLVELSFGYQDFERLFELHYDIFGLIESGLAIDINTLRK